MFHVSPAVGMIKLAGWQDVPCVTSCGDAKAGRMERCFRVSMFPVVPLLQHGKMFPCF